jgi:hypothetical protein
MELSECILQRFVRTGSLSCIGAGTGARTKGFHRLFYSSEDTFLGTARPGKPQENGA